LPAHFIEPRTDPGKGTLEVDIECFGSPDLMVDWLPAHDFKRVSTGWKPDAVTSRHHVSLDVPGGASRAKLILAFGTLDADEITVEIGQIQRGPSPVQAGAAPAAEGERWRPTGRKLAPGAQGELFVVEDTLKEHQGQWVKKVLRRINDPKARERFALEVKALQSINHPGILKIVHSDVTAKRPFYVAEFCEGGSLRDSGATKYKGQIRATLQLLFPVIDALVAAHTAGVFHRDLKPANILFRKNRTSVVGDFGICYIEGSEGPTLIDEAVGARHFLAPEMESGGRHLGEPSDKTDVYSLGKLLYWLLSGGLHFDRERHRANSLVQMFNDQRWEHIHQLLDKMVVEKPEDRIPSKLLKENLERVRSLVEDNFAILAPSVAIRCRFCGIGSYTAANVYLNNRTPCHLGLTKEQESERSDKGRLAVLRCDHCGHLESFQLDGISDPGWWDR
jgi:hypothetical protein